MKKRWCSCWSIKLADGIEKVATVHHYTFIHALIFVLRNEYNCYIESGSCIKCTIRRNK